MNRSSFSALLLLATLLVAPFPSATSESFWPAYPELSARQVHMPIVGRQFLTLGLEAQGGPVLDWRDENLALSPTAGPRARLGLHHIVSPALSMNLELSLGATYFAPHPIAPDGAGAAQTRLDWRISILARRFPLGPERGWTFAAGIDYRQAHLQQGRLLQFGPDLRLGRYLWTSEENFLIAELGLHAPIWEGLNLSDFAADETQTIPSQWTLPSLSLGIQWAF